MSLLNWSDRSNTSGKKASTSDHVCIGTLDPNFFLRAWSSSGSYHLLIGRIVIFLSHFGMDPLRSMLWHGPEETVQIGTIHWHNQ